MQVAKEVASACRIGVEVYQTSLIFFSFHFSFLTYVLNFVLSMLILFFL